MQRPQPASLPCVRLRFGLNQQARLPLARWHQYPPIGWHTSSQAYHHGPTFTKNMQWPFNDLTDLIKAAAQSSKQQACILRKAPKKQNRFLRGQSAKLQFMVWAPWAPKGAGLPGLHTVLGSQVCGLPRVMYPLCSQWCWAPKGAGLPRVLGSRGCWAPKGAGLPRLLGSRVDWAPQDHCSLGSIDSLGSQNCWAPMVRGLLMLLGSRGYWAPVITGLPRLLGS